MGSGRRIEGFNTGFNGMVNRTGGLQYGLRQCPSDLSTFTPDGHDGSCRSRLDRSNGDSPFSSPNVGSHNRTTELQQLFLPRYGKNRQLKQRAGGPKAQLSD